MNKWSELFTGLILLIIAILVAGFSSVNNWILFSTSFDLLFAAWIIFKGGLFWAVFLIGIFLVILGISDLKN